MKKLALFGLAALVASSASALTLDTPHGKQEVPDNVKRIVLLDMGTADTLYRLGAKDLVVGYSGSPLLPQFLTNAYKDAALVGSISKPDLEKIAELKPDLIVLSNRNFALEEKLKEIAPTFKADINYTLPDAYAEIKQTALNWGQITGKQKVAQELFADLDKRVAEVKKQAAGKTALVVLANDRKLSAYGPVSRFSIVYESFGFKPVDASIVSGRHGQEISYEYVKEKDPQYLFVVDRTATVTEKKDNLKETFSNNVLKQTYAVKNNHVIELDGKIWYLALGGITGTEIMVAEMEKALKIKK